MMTILKNIPSEGFQVYFEQWKKWLTKCTAAQKDHFEGNQN